MGYYILIFELFMIIFFGIFIVIIILLVGRETSRDFLDLPRHNQRKRYDDNGEETERR